MPLLDRFRRWMDIQNDIASSDGYDQYLLGFDVEHLKPLRVKTYIRRLWLAFESGQKLAPKRFFDPQAEKFSREINDWVSDLANDPGRLTAELQVDRAWGLDGEPLGSMFLADIAHTILVKRKWGEALWGCKKASEEEHRVAFRTGKLPKRGHGDAPRGESRKRKRGEDRHLELLANPKPEEGDNGPPQWPRDQEQIMLATRHWMAALLQARMKAPSVREKNVPRVTCPEDPDQRRAWLAARFAETQRESSPDPVVEPDESIDDSQSRPIFVIKEEDPASSPSPGHHQMRETTEPSAPLLDEEQEQTFVRSSVHSTRSSDTEATSLAHQLARAAGIHSTPTVAEASDATSRKSAKRRCKKRVLAGTRVNSSSENLPRQPSPTDSLSLFGEIDPEWSLVALLPLAPEPHLLSASNSFRSSARQNWQVDIATTYQTSPPSVPFQVERPPVSAVFGPKAVSESETVHPEELAILVSDDKRGDDDAGSVHTIPYSEVDFNQFADPSADDTTLGLTESTTELDPSEPARPEEPATSTRHDTHDDADTGLVGTRLDIDVSFNRAPDPSADDTTQPLAKPPARREPSETSSLGWPSLSSRHDTHDDADTGLVRRRLGSDVSFHRAADLSAGEVTPILAGPRAEIEPPSLDVSHAAFQPASVRTETQQILAPPALIVAGPSTEVLSDMDLDLSRRITSRVLSHGLHRTSVPFAGPVSNSLANASARREPPNNYHLLDPPDPSFMVSQGPGRPAPPVLPGALDTSRRRCSKCNHLLDRALDCYKPDRLGLVQFRKTCIYCRGIARPRPSLADASTQTSP